MKFSKFVVFLVVIAIAFMGFNCKESESPTESTPDLVGTWVANSDVAGTKMEYDATDINAAFKVDVLLFGASVTIAVDANDDYALTLVEPDAAPQVETGTISVSGNKVTLTPDGAPEEAVTFTFSISGDTATLVSDAGEFTFDFGTGEVPAILTLILKRLAT